MTAVTEFLTKAAMSSERVWHPVELLEWSMSAENVGQYSLSRSAVTKVLSLNEIPGGPISVTITGNNDFGHGELKNTISSMYGAKSDQVLIAQGASRCDALLAGAALRNGGTAIVETPVYEPIYRILELFADRMIDLPRRRENGFLPDPDELKKLLTKDTKVIFLTNLYNPPGIFMDNSSLAELVEVASSVGALVITDEVYLPMQEQDYRKHGFSAGAVSVGSLDKSYGLESLRVGWAIGPEDLITEAHRLNNLIGAIQPFVTEDIASQILKRPEAVDFFHRRIEECSKGRELLEEFTETTPEVNVIRPNAGINAIVELPKGTDDREFVKQLKEKKSVTVFPASLFKWPGAIRVSYGGDREKTREGFRRLTEMVAEF